MKWLRRGRFRLFRGQKGFTLIEILVAVVILAAIGVVFMRTTATNARASGILDEKVVATNLVTAYLESIRQVTYDDSANPYSTVSSNITIPTQYNVAINVLYSGDGITWQPSKDPGDLKLQKISISVSRTNGKLVLTTCTFRMKR